MQQERQLSQRNRADTSADVYLSDKQSGQSSEVLSFSIHSFDMWLYIAQFL